jgi:hypothetical protein
LWFWLLRVRVPSATPSRSSTFFRYSFELSRMDPGEIDWHERC